MPPAVVTVQPRAHRAGGGRAPADSMRLAVARRRALGDADAEPGHRAHDASEVMSVRYETSAAPAASPAPKPTAVARDPAELTPRWRSSAHCAAPIPAPAMTPLRTAADTRVDASGDEMGDVAGGREGERGEQPAPPRPERSSAADVAIDEVAVVGCGEVTHDGSFRVVVLGWLWAVIQATRTLVGWSVRWSRARASTRSTSPATWATAIATTWRSRVVVANAAARCEQVGRIRREQCGGDQGGHVVAGVGSLDDLGDGGGVAHRELVDHVFGFGGHGCSIGAGP